LAILIHGYQNSPSKAESSYGRFEDVLRAVGWAQARTRIGEAWGLLWPGDHENRFISILTYSSRIQPAMDTGKLLAAFLADLDPRTTVRLFAHSLGCRVALETTREIRRWKERGEYHGAAVEDVFLFAAAVPVPLCQPGSDSFPSALIDCGEHVYWSHRDGALDWKFRAGQSWFKKSERGRAVGRTGDPNQRWTSRLETGLGHSDYWASPNVARAIADQVSFGRRTATPVRRLSEASSASAKWHVGERRLDEQVRGQRRLW
jgi:hypothetical protein